MIAYNDFSLACLNTISTLFADDTRNAKGDVLHKVTRIITANTCRKTGSKHIQDWVKTVNTDSRLS